MVIVCLFSIALTAGTSPQKSISARREQVPFSMAIGNGELMHEIFPNTRAWEQQDRNQIMKQRKKVRNTADTKERSPVQSPCRVVTSVTHNSQSRNPYGH